jgi:hypothetical protein
MRFSVLLILAAAALPATVEGARAECGISGFFHPIYACVRHHYYYGSGHRMRVHVARRTVPRGSAAGAVPADSAGMPTVSEGGAGARLPNYFRNCEEPAPRFCFTY